LIILAQAAPACLRRTKYGGQAARDYSSAGAAACTWLNN